MGIDWQAGSKPAFQTHFAQFQSGDFTMKNPYRQVERDMLWFFNHADAAMGFKSSHAAFVAAVYGVSSTNVNPDPYTDGMLKQVKKLRHIREVFFSLPQPTRRALEACYNYECQYRYPPEIVTLYGHKAGCTLFNSNVTSLDDFVKLCRKKISSKLNQNEEILMFNIGVETRQFWEAIHVQYMLARQRVLNEKSAKK